MSQYLKQSEVADLLNLSEKSVRKLIATGELPQAVKLGGANRWNADELQEYLREVARKQAEA